MASLSLSYWFNVYMVTTTTGTYVFVLKSYVHVTIPDAVLALCLTLSSTVREAAKKVIFLGAWLLRH